MSYVIWGVFTEAEVQRNMINKKMIVGVFTLLVVLGAFGFVAASHIRSTSTVLTVGDGGNDNNSNGGDGHAGGNPDPTTGRIAL
jgi:hypothetical protein